MPSGQVDSLMLRRIREGEADAWTELIARFEGRLQAFVESRTGNRAAAEDIVQETFVGFLVSLPNYDGAAAVGELSVFDRGTQTDRLSTAARPAAHVTADFRERAWKRERALWQGPAGKQPRA